MAVSKRLRFEILRRDNHACRYCGATGVALTIDHVTPTTLGGTDAPDNLVAACVDCNAGKSSTTPDGPLVDDVATDALRWRRAMEKAAEEEADGLKERELDLDSFDFGWIRGWLPDDWRISVGRWLDLGAIATGRTSARRPGASCGRARTGPSRLCGRPRTSERRSNGLGVA